MRPTICSECKHTGLFTVCPLCGTEQPEYLRVKQIVNKQRTNGPRNRHPVFRLPRREEAK